MAKCIYILDNHTFDSEQELNDFLLEKYKYISKYGDIVFSKNIGQKQLNTINILDSKIDYNTALKRNLKYRDQYDESDELYEVLRPYTGVNRFIQQYRDENGKRLAPEFILENYWENASYRWAKGDFLQEEIDIIYPGLKKGDPKIKPITDGPTVSNKNAGPIFSKYREIIEKKWNMQGLVGEQLHFIMQQYFSETSKQKIPIRTLPDGLKFKNIKSSLTKFVQGRNKQLLLSDEVIQHMIQYAKGFQERLERDLGPDLIYYPEYIIDGETSVRMDDLDNNYKLLGVIDLLVVDKEGTVHIIDYKTSPREYKGPPEISYNSVKINTFKYQLAIYNQMLRKYGLNTINSKMYIAPIRLTNFRYENDEWVFDDIQKYEDYVDRLDLDPKLDRGNEYSLWDKVEELLPADVVDKINTENLLQNVSQQESVWFDQYSYGKEIDDKFLEKEFKKVKFNKDQNKYQYVNKRTNQVMISTSTEEEMLKKIREYFEQVPDKRWKSTINIINKLEEAKKKGDNTVELYNTQYADIPEKGKVSWFQDLMKKYFDSNWELVRNDSLEYLGMILLRNKITRTIDVVKISNRSLTYLNEFTKGNTLLTGNIQSDIIEKSKKNSQMLESYNGNIELMEAMLALNNVPELFYGNLKIGSIIAVNPKMQEGVPASNEALLYSFNTLDKISPIKQNNFNNGKIKFAKNYEMAYNRLMEILQEGRENNWATNRQFSEFASYATDDTFISAMDDAVNDPSTALRKLNELRIQLENTFQNLREVEVRDEPSKQIYDYVMMAIADLSGISFKQQLRDHSKWIQSFNIVKKGLSGTYQDNPGNLDSETLNVITNAVNNCYQNVRSLMESPIAKFKDLTEKLKQDKSFNSLIENTTGNMASLFKNMVRRENGKIDPRMMFVNPYKPNSGLSEVESKYLKEVLWEINKRRVKYQDEDQLIQMMEQAAKDDESSWFEMPLCRGNVASMMNAAGLLDTFKYKMKWWIPKTFMERFKQKVDDFLGDEVEREFEKSANLFEMTNSFQITQNKEIREKVIAENGPEYFENNLETLVLKYIFADTMKQEIDGVFPIIKSALIYLTNQEALQNTKFSDDIDYLKNYVKSRIYNKSLDDEKSKKVSAVIGAVQSTTSKLALAFSPVSGLYQVIESLWKNMSIVLRKPMGIDTFGFEEYAWAMKTLFKDMMSPNQEYSKTSLINQMLGINDMDMNTYVDKIKSDQRGIWNIWSAMAFKFTSRPDYYSRMSIFIAQMKKDGTWDAYKVVNNKLVYDWKLDKRFDAFAKGDKSNLKKYNEQMGLYYSVAKQLVSENTKNPDGTLFKIGDPLPKAYTTQQSEGYKSLSDMIYGYYSHEKKSMIHSFGLGAMFMQFRTYWSGKKNQYLAPGGVKMMGKMVQYEETKKDENGNDVIVKYYHKLDENGNVTNEITDQDTGVPFYVWKGQWQEGIILTLFKCFEVMWPDLKSGNFTKAFDDVAKNIWNNEDINMRTIYRSNILQIVTELGVFIVIGNILARWLMSLFQEHIKEEKQYATSFGSQVANTAYYIGINSLRSSTDDANFINSIGGILVDWTPMSIRTINSLYKQWSGVIAGDNSLYNAAINSTAFTRQTKYIWNYLTDN